MIRIGQGIYGKVNFVDGSAPEYDRPYLVIAVDSENIGVLNVSSVTGKEDKLFYPTNKYLNKHFPPFVKKTFVKLDSLVYIPVSEISSFSILANGGTLDEVELNAIIKKVLG